MQIQSVFDPAFSAYGRIITGYDFTPLLEKLEATTPKPENEVIYVPSAQTLETLPGAREIQNHIYGGMPIQIGYCNGSNTKLNCVEYHRDSELNIPADDMVLLVAREQDIIDGRLDTAKVEAFAAPAGTAVELYATTLHYAPCNGKKGEGFRVVIVLARGTNAEKPKIDTKSPEDALLWACNKWLIAHPDSNEAAQGAFVGLDGENIDIANII